VHLPLGAGENPPLVKQEVRFLVAVVLPFFIEQRDDHDLRAIGRLHEPERDDVGGVVVLLVLVGMIGDAGPVLLSDFPAIEADLSCTVERGRRQQQARKHDA
jgi:hypothetical protein